jgi:hypothetical protein
MRIRRPSTPHLQAAAHPGDSFSGRRVAGDGAVRPAIAQPLQVAADLPGSGQDDPVAPLRLAWMPGRAQLPRIIVLRVMGRLLRSRPATVAVLSGGANTRHDVALRATDLRARVQAGNWPAIAAPAAGRRARR